MMRDEKDADNSLSLKDDKGTARKKKTLKIWQQTYEVEVASLGQVLSLYYLLDLLVFSLPTYKHFLSS